MSYVCLWHPSWLTAAASSAEAGTGVAAEAATGAGPDLELIASLLEVVPRCAVEARGVVWADARGLPLLGTARELLRRAEEREVVEEVRAGAAATPVAAELAARAGEAGGGSGLTIVPPGGDREFLAPLPLMLLEPSPPLLSLLEGVGVWSCGELAALDGEAVEVRFGPEGVALWRLARGEDTRRLFAPLKRERPSASLDFIDYVVTDPERLLFTANALLGSVCETLGERGEHARRMTLRLPLGNGQVWQRTLRPARPTASRERWLRLIRMVLESLTVPDAVAGMALEVEATEAAAAVQGDLFDPGFGTAGAVEQAVARLIESQGPVVVEPENDRHPLVERRTRWVPVDVSKVADIPRATDAGDGPKDPPVRPALSLQLLPEPCPILVDTSGRRDHSIPVRFRDREGWKQLVTSAGPDRVSGGRWETPYAREYFRCVTGEGALVWLFRDARADSWYLHGWWD